jgi:hypothetical protein
VWRCGVYSQPLLPPAVCESAAFASMRGILLAPYDHSWASRCSYLGLGLLGRSAGVLGCTFHENAPEKGCRLAFWARVLPWMSQSGHATSSHMLVPPWCWRKKPEHRNPRRTLRTEAMKTGRTITTTQAGSALVCFDPTKIDTWHKLDFWVGELQENEPRCKIYLVETKRARKCLSPFLLQQQCSTALCVRVSCLDCRISSPCAQRHHLPSLHGRRPLPRRASYKSVTAQRLWM